MACSDLDWLTWKIGQIGRLIKSPKLVWEGVVYQIKGNNNFISFLIQLYNSSR